MSRPMSSHPTELELEILKIVWRRGASSVREVRGELAASAGRDLAHTTVITVMNIMTDKGYLKRARQGQGFVYTANAPENSTLGKMLRDLVNRAFGGSPVAAMLNLLETSDVSERELDELRELLARKARERRK